jgi:hypothetical protein
MNETHDLSTDPRIYMAAERTFLAWIRTGIAFMGFGFVVARFGLFLREIALSKLRLAQRYREKFKAVGYEFGTSVINVMRCPACPKDAKPDPDKAALKAGIVEILGEDEDGIAATMEDFGL